MTIEPQLTKPAWLTKLLPFESHFVQIGRNRMHYLDEGGEDPKKPVVLLIHGNPTWCFYYRNLVHALSKNFRVIAPDFIGCGLSDHPESQHFRAIDRINHLQEFIKLLGIERYSLVMHDWGGSIGTGVAIRNPDAIERLVYLNTTLTETESLPRLIKTAARPFIGKYLTKYSKRFLSFTTELGVGKKLPRYVKKAYFFPYKGYLRRTAIWDFVADIPFDSSHPSYSQMLDLADGIPLLKDKPVQIVWGLKDPCFHREMLSKVSGHFPQADVLEIADASHLVLEDAPEISTTTIERFLLGRGGLSREAKRWEETSLGSTSSVLFENLKKQIEECSVDPAIIVPTFLGDKLRSEQVSFGELGELIQRYRRGLTELGLRPSDKVLMLVPPGIDFLALSYAVMGCGGIPFFLDPGMGKEKLSQCIDEICPDVMLGSPKAQIFRVLKGRRLFARLKFSVVTCDLGMPGVYTTAFLKKFSARPMPVAASHNPVLVAYTSGATGTPKGVVFTEENLAAQLRIFETELGIKRGNRDLPLLPIFSLFQVALGVTSIFPPLDPSKPLQFEPKRLVKIIDHFRVQTSFGSPTLWNKLAEYCVRSRSTLKTVQHVFMAGAPVPDSTLDIVVRIAPEAKVSTPYGATEALPSTLLFAEQRKPLRDVAASSGERGTPVGKAVSGITIKIIKPAEGVIRSTQEWSELPPYEIGEVVVRGPNVSPRYFSRERATLQAKIPDEESGFWHRMGDLGYLDDAGNLYFCGRKVHAVRSNSSRMYYSVPTEEHFNSHPKVNRSALIPRASKLGLAVVIEPLPQFRPHSAEEEKMFREELLKLAAESPLTKDIAEFFFHDSFPVDPRHNAKIFREQLAKLFEGEGVHSKAA